MPVSIKKLPNKARYRVSTPGHVTARSTTKAKAKAQARLLYAVDRGWTPTKLVDSLIQEAPWCDTHYDASEGDPHGLNSLVSWHHITDDDGKTMFQVMAPWIGFEDNKAMQTFDPAEIESALKVIGDLKYPVNYSADGKYTHGFVPAHVLFDVKGFGSRFKKLLELNYILPGRGVGGKEFSIDVRRPDLKKSDIVRAFPELPVQSTSYATSSLPTMNFLGYDIARVALSGPDVMIVYPRDQKEKTERRLAKIEPASETQD